MFNTCAVRENADNKLYGNLSHLAPRKQADPDMQIAVGGCLAQKDRDTVLRKAPWVDVVFGTHNIGSLPTLLDRARHNRAAQVEIVEALRGIPVRAARPRANPLMPHGFRSRSAATTPARSASCPRCAARRSTAGPATCWPRCQSLVDQGVLEVTLLGQNVNAYGVSFADPEQPRDRGAFAKLLRACGRIDGLERVRFTSPHPAEFTDDVIEAMAETPNVCPTLHMPLQSGSDRILRAMRRSYRAERYLGIIDRVRAAIPHAAITTDLIVGFPGETEEDFQATLDVVAAARFASAFTFQYSKRPGTPAAELDGQLPKAVVQERYQRLIDLQERISLEENAAQIGRTVELLVATGEGRKDASTARMSGRARDGRLVHFNPAGARHPARRHRHHHRHRRRAAPPDRRRRAVDTHRRTRAGDAHAAGQRPRTGVGLGMPGIGVPARAADVVRVCAGDRGDPDNGDFDEFKGDIEAAERRVAREIDPGARALVIAIGVFVLLLTFVLPHTGGAKGLGRAGRRRRGDPRRDRAAVAGVHLAGAGVRRRLLDAGAADPPMGAGVDRAGRVHGGVLHGPAGGVVAADRARTAPRARHRADHRLARGDRADLSTGRGRCGRAPRCSSPPRRNAAGHVAERQQQGPARRLRRRRRRPRDGPRRSA